MEVGPLNSIKPPVQEPKDGKTEQAGKITPGSNRLDTGEARAASADADGAKISSKADDLEAAQEKIAFANTAKQAVLIIIDGIKSIETGTSAEEVKAEIEKAVNTTFNREPVFNGSTLTEKAPDGTETTVKVPGIKELKDKVTPLIKDAIAGQEAERVAYKEIDKFYQDLQKLSDSVKENVKMHIGASNAGAGRAMSKDVEAARASLRQVAQKAEGMKHFNPPKEMADKVVKLLK